MAVFTWTRDAALVTKGLLDQLIQSGDESIETVLQNYVDTQAVLQHLSTPSGDCTFTTCPFYALSRVESCLFSPLMSDDMQTLLVDSPSPSFTSTRLPSQVLGVDRNATGPLFARRR